MTLDSFSLFSYVDFNYFSKLFSLLFSFAVLKQAPNGKYISPPAKEDIFLTDQPGTLGYQIDFRN